MTENTVYHQVLSETDFAQSMESASFYDAGRPSQTRLHPNSTLLVMADRSAVHRLNETDGGVSANNPMDSHILN